VAAGLEISLFGSCVLRRADASAEEITGAKHRALFALLVTAPLNRRSRRFLQEMLWGFADYESGHQNLRRALSDLRKKIGADFDTILTVTNKEIEIDMSRVKVIGHPSHGPFLHDLNVREPSFVAWRDSIRSDPSAVKALCFISNKRGPIRIRPRVCALPLTVPPGDAELAIAGDWIAEEASRMMSRSSLLSVISHLSGRAMAQRFIDIVNVRDTLDVDYLMTGAMRRQGNLLIADVDFTDVQTGTLLWNRHLSCPIGHFSQEAAGWLVNIVQTVGRSIAETTLHAGRQTPLPEIPDHKLLIAGATAMHHPKLGDFLRARQFLDEAAARAPANPHVFAWLGKWYVLSIFKYYSTDRQRDTQKALDCTARALDLDPQSSFGLTIDGFVHGNILKNMDLAERRYSAAQEINPSESLAWLLRGSLMTFSDEGQSAIKATTMARDLSPIDPFGYYFDSLASSAHLAGGEYEKALELADRSLASNDRHISTLRTRIVALHALDRGDEAHAAAQDLMRRFPSFNLEDYRKTHPSADRKIGKLVINALSASGIS
jgi:TolB-like protein